jgi:outer membrane lipoprotein-sorting protein
MRSLILRKIPRVVSVLALTGVVSTLLLNAENAWAAPSRMFQCESNGTLISTDGQKNLQQVQERYRKVLQFRAEFMQRSTLKALQTAERSSGTMSYRKPGEMRWSYREPEAQEFVLQGETLKFYQPLDAQLVIDRVQQVLVSELPLGFIMGVGDLGKDFALKLACRVKDGLLFELVPQRSLQRSGQSATQASPQASPQEEPSEQLAAMRLVVRKDDYFPIAAAVTDVSGNLTEISLFEPQINQELPESEFEVKVPAGTDVIDRRVSAMPAKQPPGTLQERDLM